VVLTGRRSTYDVTDLGAEEEPIELVQLLARIFELPLFFMIFAIGQHLALGVVGFRVAVGGDIQQEGRHVTDIDKSEKRMRLQYI